MLSDLKVLDLSRVLAGPLTTMILGDLGARVIKVERPMHGDDTRSWGPPFDDRGESAYYLSVNRNKKSVALDLDNPRDLDLVVELAGKADVVVENFKPGTLERRGLDPGFILAANPNLIWCSITGFGPDSIRAGYDLVVQAECGWMSITGEAEGDPMRVGVALADILAGKDATIAILAALVRRGTDRPPMSAVDRRISISLRASATAALINVAQNSLVGGGDAKRWGNQHPNLVPYQLFHASDRPLIVAVGNDGQWSALVRALGLDDLAADETLSTNAGRLAQRERVVSAVTELLRTKQACEWVVALDHAGVPCGVVKSVLEALAEVNASSLTGIEPSVPGTVRLAPPRLDEHGVLIRERAWDAFDGDV